ncbi:MAG: DUF4097 domain-containing protein [Clostridiales bacterium]|nr:DUF4097 domain-containing protein [Clostridiales bacterium]
MKTFTRVWLIISLLAIGIGAVVLIVAAIYGIKWRKINNHSFYERYENVESLDFEFSHGKVTIREGDAFSIEAKNVPEKFFKSYVSNGVWYIREKYGIFNIIDLDIRDINIFGLRFADGSREITITLPRDFTARKCDLDIGAGKVDVKAIYAEEGKFRVGAGELDIQQLRITRRSEYEVGAGSMTIGNIAAHDAEVECGLGEIKIKGCLTGDNVIKCGIGRIELDLEGDERDYSYELSSGLGNVVIDKHSYSHVNKKIDNNADSMLVLECGIGNINVDFH